VLQGKGAIPNEEPKKRNRGKKALISRDRMCPDSAVKTKKRRIPQTRRGGGRARKNEVRLHGKGKLRDLQGLKKLKGGVRREEKLPPKKKRRVEGIVWGAFMNGGFFEENPLFRVVVTFWAEQGLKVYPR